MSNRYERFYTMGLKLIRDFGQQITLTSHPSAQEYDPATGELITSEEPVTISAFGVSANYTSFERMNSQNKEKTLIEEGDKKLYVSCNIGEKPAIGMITTINGVQWVVHGINSIEPADTPIIYVLNIRRHG